MNAPDHEFSLVWQWYRAQIRAAYERGQKEPPCTTQDCEHFAEWCGLCMDAMLTKAEAAAEKRGAEAEMSRTVTDAFERGLKVACGECAGQPMPPGAYEMWHKLGHPRPA